MTSQLQHPSHRSSVNKLLQLLALICLLTHCVYALADSNPTTLENKYDHLGTSFAEAINDKNLQGLSKLFDFIGFAERTAKIIFGEESSESKDFVRGLTKAGSEAFLEPRFVGVFNQEGRASFLKTLEKTKPLVRIDYPEGGHEYIELSTELNSTGAAMITDIFILTSGTQLSDSIANASQMLLTPSKSMIRKLFGVKEVDSDLLKTYKKLGSLQKKGKFEKVYQTLQTLPDEIKHSRVMLDLSITSSQAVSEEEYRKQLSLLDKYYGDDESTAFILIDHHFFNQAYDKADKSIDRLINRYGEDGALLNLKAGIAFVSGDMSKTRDYARQAMLIEPSFEDSYWTLVSTLTQEKEYKDLVETFKLLQNQFGYTFTTEAFNEDEFYQEFVKSPEFDSWLN